MSLIDVLKVRTLTPAEAERYLYLLPDAPLPDAVRLAFGELERDRLQANAEADEVEQELEAAITICPMCGHEPEVTQSTK